MKITVTKNGPYIVTGGVPISVMEICNDDEGYSRTWRETTRYPLKEQYALCRCGRSKNKPFCDGTHLKGNFNGTETAGNERYLKQPMIIKGPDLELDDYEHLCVHARFCMRAGGVWNLTENSDIPEARETAIEEACNCPSGRLVIRDRRTGKPIEPELERSIVVIECPPGESTGRSGYEEAFRSFHQRETLHGQEQADPLPLREIAQQTVLRWESCTRMRTDCS